jgi:hypothetical protein
VHKGTAVLDFLFLNLSSWKKSTEGRDNVFFPLKDIKVLKE